MPPYEALPFCPSHCKGGEAAAKWQSFVEKENIIGPWSTSGSQEQPMAEEKEKEPEEPEVPEDGRS